MSEKTMKDNVISDSTKSRLLQQMDQNSEVTIEQEEIEVEGETDSDESDGYDVTQQRPDEIMDEDVEEYESEEDSEDDRIDDQQPEPEHLDTVPDRMLVESKPGESEEDTVAREMARLQQLARDGHSN